MLDLSLVPIAKQDELVNEVNQSVELTSKGIELVNEVNQSVELTSKPPLPVTSKGGLPQLVNEVNSNNTHVTKPINNNTHTRSYENFENKFNPKFNRHVPKGLELEGFAEWHLGKSRNDWHEDLLAIAQKHLLAHEKPSGRGDAINFINNICFREDWAKFELLTDEAKLRQKPKQAIATNPADNYIPRPHPSTWTDEQKTWTHEDWQNYLREKQPA